MTKLSFVLVSILASTGCATQAPDASEPATTADYAALAEASRPVVPTLGPPADRMGRPEVTNIIMAGTTVKAAYNAEDTFAVSATGSATYQQIIRGMLTRYDTFDGVDDATDAETAATAALLVDDALVVDLSRPCDVNTNGYLAVERAELAGVAPASCGGRSPNEDSIDEVLTAITVGIARTGPVVSDRINQSTGIATNAFPYLLPPHLLTPPPAQ